MCHRARRTLRVSPPPEPYDRPADSRFALTPHIRDEELRKAITAVFHWAKGLGPPPVDDSASAILQSVVAPTAIPDGALATSPDREADFIFIPNGDGYEIRGFGNSGHVSAHQCKGLHQVFQLVQTPGQLVPFSVLDETSQDQRFQADTHSRQDATDPEGLQQISQRLQEAQEERRRAEADNNTVEADLCREEIDTLNSRLSADTDHRGRPRDLNNPNNPGALVSMGP